MPFHVWKPCDTTWHDGKSAGKVWYFKYGLNYFFLFLVIAKVTCKSGIADFPHGYTRLGCAGSGSHSSGNISIRTDWGDCDLILQNNIRTE